MLIKDWWYALKVCRKYGIRWDPFFGLAKAECWFAWWENYKKYKTTIKINPFYTGFLDSFMHEVGHHIRHRDCYMKASSIAEYEESVSDSLKEEFKAWRYSKLALRGRFNNDRARAMFSTYLPSYIDDKGQDEAIRVFTSYDKRLK